MDDQKKEVTYILGAGASCYSMPLVENFADRFNGFLKFIYTNLGSPEAMNFRKEAMQFISEVESHQTFDTFFKKLFHRREDLYISKCKAILLVFFLFEHLVPPSIFKSSLSKTYEKYSLDPRYEALIAGLLKPTQGFEFTRPVNFVTWNYDLNLLFAVKNFLHSKKSIVEFIDESISEDGVFEIGGQLTIYHLNGFVYHSILEKFEESINNEEKFKKNMQSIFEQYSIGNSKLLNDALKIKFAWETVPKENQNDMPTLIQLAANSIQKSKDILLIGYSIPPYNRLYDSHLINQKNLEYSSFYIQNLFPEDILDIVENDLDVFIAREYSGAPKVRTKSNCKSFVLV